MKIIVGHELSTTGLTDIRTQPLAEFAGFVVVGLVPAIFLAEDLEWDGPLVTRTFRLVSTGEAFNRESRVRGSAVLVDGRLRHIVELTEVRP